jgi:hypothetical protein
MTKKNNEMANKLKGAFQQAGKELPATPPKVQAVNTSSKIVESKSSTKDKNSTRSHKNKVTTKPGRGRAHNNSDPIFDEAIMSVYKGSNPDKPVSAVKKSRMQEKSSIELISGVSFNPAIYPGQALEKIGQTIINELSCATQQSKLSSTEVQLVIGLDLGTSTTKVVIGDPDRKRFFAVPFFPGSDNPYLVSTAIKEVVSGNLIIDTGNDARIQRNIKLMLMQEDSPHNLALVAGYVAQIVRYSINWFVAAHSDEYRGIGFFWTMALGLPVDSARQRDLEERFRLAAIAGAQCAISIWPIQMDMISRTVAKVKLELAEQFLPENSSSFEELGTESGIVVVVPEIAAQVVGLYKSRRWDVKRPISFLMDIGAGTVDAAVFSLVDPMVSDKDLRFCAFSCQVSELGIVNLHQSRVDWLLEKLPQDIHCREQIVDFLDRLRDLKGFSLTIPASIDDYLNCTKIVRGDDKGVPDDSYLFELRKKIVGDVLVKGKQKNESNSTWVNLRTLVAGGGSRSEFYKGFIQSVSSETSFKLQTEPMEKPDNLDAPGLPLNEYDRLSVAYGLAQGTQWEYLWPEEIENIPMKKRDVAGYFVGKDMV